MGGAVDLERETLHVMDDQRRVAMVETKTREGGAALGAPVTRWRFQLDNHLGSATLELDQAGNVISYEEYHPYGSTAFSATSASSEVSAKRYRYTGKERDEETGLYYHGARYYAPWLGRWTAADPAGMVDGPNIYAYCADSPIANRDANGMEKTACPTGNCHTQNQSPSSYLKALADKEPALSADDVKALVEADKAAAKAHADAEVKTLQDIKQRDEAAGNGVVCQHSCHGLSAIKGVGQTTEHANASAKQAATLILAPVAIVGGAEAVATYGLVEGLVLPVVGSEVGGTVAHGTAKALGASDDTAEVIGFAGSVLGGAGATKLKLSLPDAESGGAKWLSRDAFGTGATKTEYSPRGAIHGQETESYCTAANCQNILSDAGHNFTQADIANAIGTTDRGTILAEVPGGLKQLGVPNARFESELTLDQLSEILQPGRSAVVGARIPGTGPHTLTVDSVDHGAGVVFLRDPLPGLKGASYGIPTSDFTRVWKGTAVFLF
ncbi:MAG TPA: RHS repeat-associated core domain-containing protein [Polyangiaceae bacterium]|nr:RHS repeat-associated core domain-containing protein [Polyangiaceae bacterium]